MEYVIVISPENREISLKIMESVNSDNSDNIFSNLSPVASIDNFPVYVIPLFHSTNRYRRNNTFFLCTEKDIVEITGMAIVPIPDKNVAYKLIDKIEEMIEWQGDLNEN